MKLVYNSVRFRSREHLVSYIQSIELGSDPETMRIQFARIMAGQPSGVVGRLGGVSGIFVGSGDLRAIWLHGGGYIFGAPSTHTFAASHIAKNINGKIFIPQYSLAPEKIWPAQLNDINQILDTIKERITIIGDSAGGHLAIQAGLRRTDKIIQLILFSPNTDRTGKSRTRIINEDKDVINDDKTDTKLFHLAAPNLHPFSPDASPILADLSNFPKTCIFVGSEEILLDDSLLFQKAVSHAARDICVKVLPDQFHMFWQWPDVLPEANKALTEASAYISNLY